MEESIGLRAEGRKAVGHPVDVASGVVFTAWDDFQIGGTWKFAWSRFYSSNSAQQWGLGQGWRSPYFSFITTTTNGPVYCHDDGDVGFIYQSEHSAWLAVRHPMRLQARGDILHLWDWSAGKTYVFEKSPGIEQHWRLSRIQPKSGPSWDLTYTDAGRLQFIQYGERYRLELFYGDQECLERIEMFGLTTGERLSLSRYEYDDRRRLIAVYNAAGAALRYGYDNEGRMVSESNRLGGTFHFDYDSAGRCSRTYGDGGFGARWLRYFEQPRLTEVHDAAGNVTRYFANQQGQIVREVAPDGSVFISHYDAQGRLALLESPNGSAFVMTYDAYDNILSLTDGLGRKTSYEYNALNLPIKVINADGTERQWQYDAHGNLICVIDQNGQSWRYTRAADGTAIGYTTPGGCTVTATPSPDGRTLEVVDPYGWLRFEHDARGNLVRREDQLGLIEQRKYDAVGNLIAVQFADGASYQFAYDADGNVVRETDQLDQVTRYEFSPFGQILRKTFSDGATIALKYDQEGKLIETLNEIGLSSRCAYHKTGHLAAQTFFDGRAEKYTYDKVGNLIGISRANSRKIEQQFDAAGNLLLQRDENGETVNFSYDAMNRLTAVISAGTHLQFVYNALGQLLLEKQNGAEVEYEYDADGNRISRWYKQGTAGRVAFAFDGRRRLVRISQGDATLQSADYDTRDQMIARAVLGSVTESWSHDLPNRHHAQKVTGVVCHLSFEYQYDANGELRSRVDSLWGLSKYSYNSRGWLIAERTDIADRVVDYDAAGNLSRVDGIAAHLDNGLLLSDGTRRLSYSAAAELQVVENSHYRAEYAYDGFENLRQVADSSGAKIEITYDGLRRRVQKQDARGASEFIWSGQELIAERGPKGDCIEYVGFNFTPLLQFVQGNWYGVFTNPSGVPVALTDASGKVVWHPQYDLFGKLRNAEGRGPASPFRLRGQYDDGDLRLHYNRFRYYDPAVARFVTPDPIGLVGGLNEFRFDLNPISWQDPLGLRCKLVHFRIRANPARGSMAEWRAKRDAFNAARSNPNARIPGKKDYDERIRPEADREAAAARRAGGYTAADDADHPGDVRATGLLGQTLEPRVSGVNRSWGSQVGSQARQRDEGDRTPRADLVDDDGNVIQ